MLMNEKEARVKWCPLTRAAKMQHGDVVPSQQAVFNRLAGDPGETVIASVTMCIGTDCTMWRWYGTYPISDFKIASNSKAMSEAEAGDLVKNPPPIGWIFIPYNEQEGDPARWVEPAELSHSRRKGYCGLAGRPEVA